VNYVVLAGYLCSHGELVHFEGDGPIVGVVAANAVQTGHAIGWVQAQAAQQLSLHLNDLREHSK
jgi:hypothetical protein